MPSTSLCRCVSDHSRRTQERTRPDHPALTALSLTDFRNYSETRFTLSGHLAVFTGRNGAGKTNLLEAVSLLTPGRGLRRAAFADMARLGSTGLWAIAATVRHEAIETRLGTGLREAGERSRHVRINGATAPSAETLMDYVRLVWLTPSLDGLFTGAAGERRRFLDRLVLTLDPAHARRIVEFERLARSRNRLLGDGGDSQWLDAVEAGLAASAVAVSDARADTVARLGERIGAQAGLGAEFPVASLALAGAFEEKRAGRSAAEAEAAYLAMLRATRGRDHAAGRTLDGPHRSDLAVTFAEKEMPAALSSTGEQKALLIGLVLAHADLVAHVSAVMPIVLLDEVAAHLDEGRRAALFDRLEGIGCQALITGTEPTLFASAHGRAEHFEVRDGAVRAL